MTCELSIEEKVQDTTLSGQSDMHCLLRYERRGSFWISWNTDKPSMLTKQKAQTSRVRPEKKTAFLLQHDKARPGNSLKTMEHIVSLGCTVIPHPHIVQI